MPLILFMPTTRSCGSYIILSTIYSTVKYTIFLKIFAKKREKPAMRREINKQFLKNLWITKNSFQMEGIFKYLNSLTYNF